MISALPLADSGDLAGSAKRRRVTLGQIEQELGAAGLANPCMSLLFGVGAKRRTFTEDQAMKRRRTGPSPCLGAASEAIVPSRDALPQQSEHDLSEACVPYVPRCSQRGASRPKLLVPAGPVPISFAFADNGWLVAELPPHWRPLVIVPGCSHAEVAGVAIDAKGTAYLVSAAGQILAVVPAESLAANVQAGSSSSAGQVLAMVPRQGVSVQAGSSAVHTLEDEVKIELLGNAPKAAANGVQSTGNMPTGAVSMSRTCRPAANLNVADVLISEDMDEDM